MRKAHSIRDFVGETPRRRWQPFVGLLCLPLGALPLAGNPHDMLLGLVIAIGLSMLGCLILLLIR